jgi:eukaryotic-like serine/threonine-protein kinase
VQTRLEGLDGETRRMLRAASIFGEVFWPGGVEALLGGAGAGPSWAALVATRDVVVQRAGSRFAGEEELGFRNALLREAAYAMLTPGDRALGHLLAGDWLEQHGEGDALVLAHHFDRGGDGPRAGGHYLHAAQ